MNTAQQSVEATNPDCGALLRGGNPVEDSRGFRRCLGQYPTGVAVVTANYKGELIGMTVNSFASVSLDPPLILWSIRRESRSVEAFTGAQHFVVNVLADDQVSVSQWFASAHPERFELAPWSEGVGGAPLLHGSVAQLECERVAVHEAGDHLILIGEVKQYAHFDGKPLAFSNGGYAQCLPREHVIN